jgi:hypothetical protein
MLARTTIRKILFTSLVALLLCGIVASEFPELLNITDNTSNDFTLRKTNTEGLRALADRPFRFPDTNYTGPTPTSLHSRLSVFEKAAPLPSELFTLHSVLRT